MKTVKMQVLMKRIVKNIYMGLSTILVPHGSIRTSYSVYIWVLLLACLPFMACADAPLADGGEFLPKPSSASTASARLDPAKAGASDAWLQTVQSGIAHGERAIREDGAGGFRVTHRRQGFVARFEQDGGLKVGPRRGDGADMGMRLAGLGRGGVQQPLGLGRVGLGACGAAKALDEKGACLKRLEIEHGGVLEWWESRNEGLEQGFVVAQGPAGMASEPLELEVEVDGAAVELGGARASSATLRVDEQTKWSYSGLHAEDARGKVLQSWMEPSALGGIVLVVEDKDAEYPITVDPILSAAAAWTAESNQADAKLGSAVASAGDVNGDGYGDIIVGAPYYDNGQGAAGKVFVYLGGPGGISAIPPWTAESGQTGAFFGQSVASAGDINGDGFGDIIVGAYGYDNGQGAAGKVFVYLGSAGGISAILPWTAESNQANAEFGQSVASAGDINGDGFGDIIIGARHYDKGQTNEGMAFVYLGGAGGISATPPWTAESDQEFAEFGHSVASAGDINGDGFGDIIVGARVYDNGQGAAGKVFVYLGSAGGISAIPPWTAESNQAGAWFGQSVASAGDVNGDGFGDIIVGAYGYDNGQGAAGKVFVYRGSAGGISAIPPWTAESNQAGALFGQSVASAGDINGDGFGDIIVGAYYNDNVEVDEGVAFVYLGSAGGLSASADWSAESNQAGALFGISVASAGDINGDGFGDIIVGALQYDNPQSNEGSAFVYMGGPTDLPLTTAWTAESDQANAYFGVSVASAGDVNGDGFGDVIVGAHQYSNGESDEGRAFVYLGSPLGLSASPTWTAESNQPDAYFGWSVASAGDVNGDGFGDIIVGATSYTKGKSNEGRAYVYLGSAAGLLASPAWTAESNRENADFGWSVAGAGDINGDGFGDIIVGAPSYDNGEIEEGRAFVYLGSAAGLSASPAWTTESDQADANFGWSVAGAGDVNGDGFGDIIVGARWYDNGEDNEGKVFAYLGSPGGPSANPDWSAESNRIGAYLGWSVAGAGDVNGDGFGDIIVGATNYSNMQVNEGAAFVYLGNAAGLAESPDWSAESDQPEAYLGWSVAGAGDVNGDGFGDVIVGATDYDNVENEEGAAFVYLGSATGLATSHTWTVGSKQNTAYFGTCVASAGDINGDGFGDIIVGSDYYDNAKTDSGRAFVFSIPSTGQPNLRLSDPVAGHPVAPWNALAGSSVTATAKGATPFGRLRVKAEVEVKPLGAAFDGLGTTLSASWDPGFSSGTFQDIAANATGLAPGQPYHLRARLRYDPSQGIPAVASRWIYAPLSGDARGVHFRGNLSGTCTGSNPIVCSPKNECEEAGTCDPASGKCIQVLKPDNTPCQINGTCVAGECLLTCITADDCRPDPNFFDCVNNHCVPRTEGPLDSQCACRTPGAPSPSSEYSGVWMLLGLSLLAQRRRSRRPN